MLIEIFPLPLMTYLGFFTTSVVLALAPGPDNLFVLMQSAIYGRRAGLLIVLGLCTGLLVHITLVAMGVSTLINATPWALQTLSLCGAAYLLWMAWGAWHAGAITRPKAHAGNKYAEQPHSQSHQAMYLRGVILNVSNPKVTLFFIAFLPHFTDPALGSIAAQFIQLGALFVLATLLIFGGIALGVGSVRNGLESARAQQTLNRLAALVFVGLSVKLLWFT